MLTRSTRILPLAFATTLALGACSSDSGIAEPSPMVNADLHEILLTAIQDEFHAEAVYEGVLDDFGIVRPFSNIINAEVRHSGVIARLYENRGWTIPANEWTPDRVPHFDSVAEACAVGVEAEIANVQVYDDLLGTGGLPADVLQVFTSNRAASRENHLPAFQRCGGM